MKKYTVDDYFLKNWKARGIPTICDYDHCKDASLRIGNVIFVSRSVRTLRGTGARVRMKAVHEECEELRRI